MTSAHLLVVVSAHGYGHFAQTSLVLNALHTLNPAIRITLRSVLPAHLIRSRLTMPVDIISETADFGMLMDSALDVRRDESFAAYQKLHGDWEHQLAEEVRRIEAIRPDVILANVPYLTLVAAAKAGIPAFAFCSLNWADIFLDYFVDRPGAGPIHQQMADAYNSAQAFFCPQPSMAMPSFNNRRDVGPVAAIGRSQRDRLDRRFGLAGKRLVLIVPGGIATHISLEDWPVIDGVCWLPAWTVTSRRGDILPHSATGLEFTDLLASCDAVVTKPGYGAITEAVCNHKPVLFVRRGDWAEEPFLLEWLMRHGCAREVSREQFFTGHVGEALSDIFTQAVPVAPRPTGADEIARALLPWLAP